MKAIPAPMTDRCAFTEGVTRGERRVVRIPPLKKCSTEVTIKITNNDTSVQVTMKEMKGRVKM